MAGGCQHGFVARGLDELGRLLEEGKAVSDGRVTSLAAWAKQTPSPASALRTCRTRADASSEEAAEGGQGAARLREALAGCGPLSSQATVVADESAGKAAQHSDMGTDDGEGWNQVTKLLCRSEVSRPKQYNSTGFLRIFRNVCVCPQIFRNVCVWTHTHIISRRGCRPRRPSARYVQTHLASRAGKTAAPASAAPCPQAPPPSLSPPGRQI